MFSATKSHSQESWDCCTVRQTGSRFFAHALIHLLVLGILSYWNVGSDHSAARWPTAEAFLASIAGNPISSLSIKPIRYLKEESLGNNRRVTGLRFDFLVGFSKFALRLGCKSIFRSVVNLMFLTVAQS